MPKGKIMSACAQQFFRKLMLVHILKMPCSDWYGTNPQNQSKFVIVPFQHAICAPPFMKRLLHVKKIYPFLPSTIQTNFLSLSAANSYRSWRAYLSQNGIYSLVFYFILAILMNHLCKILSDRGTYLSRFLRPAFLAFFRLL